MFSLEQCDLLVTTGGVSMGDRDLLRYSTVGVIVDSQHP